jgi:hypothetical protein
MDCIGGNRFKASEKRMATAFPAAYAADPAPVPLFGAAKAVFLLRLG